MEIQKSPVTSTIYRWNPVSSLFAQRTIVDVSHSNSIDYFAVDGSVFVVFTSKSDNKQTIERPYERHCELLHIYQVNISLIYAL